MSRLQPIEEILPDAARLLGPEERLLVWETVAASFGADLSRSPSGTGGSAPPPEGWTNVGRTVRDTLLGDGPSPSPGAFDAALGGTAVSGPAGSLAAQVHRGLSGPARRLMITDRRLVVVEETGVDRVPGAGADGRARIVRALRTELAIPRPQLWAVRRAGKLLQRGRVEIAFVDGSVVAIMAGMLGAGPADRIVAALVAPS